jgi:hypothetical protein
LIGDDNILKRFSRIVPMPQLAPLLYWVRFAEAKQTQNP